MPKTDVSLPPLSYTLFRALLSVALIANVAVWMQNVAAAWLMTSLSTSPLMVALIQTAISLPAFFFGIPAGVLADRVDRRKLLLSIYVWMMLASTLLVVVVELDVVGPWSLLCLVFLSGIGSALTLPVLQASISDTVPGASLLPAITLNSIAYNTARALGPALAGLIIAGVGVHAVFVLNLVLLLIVLLVLVFCYTTVARPQPPNAAISAVREGLVYVRNERLLHGYLLRVIAFTGCASSLWAMLPLISKLVVDGEGSYGYLLSSLGFGSVIGGFSLSWLRTRCADLDSLLSLSTILFAVSMLVVAWIPPLPVMYVMLILGGMAWINFTSPINAAFQGGLPAWVMARAIAVFLLSFQVAMAVGGVIWGLVASVFGVTQALSAAAIGMMLSLLLARRYPTPGGQ
ncbi:Predicted arabinose efflux permease, MFS family [Pseudomonas marginalis]|uniref:MFS transporter n=1 Tax=Pseudomonas marginalis TaxID=298 RepID=UPI0008964401|nr:MFS transporter [Pseudomonas marginalis]SEB61727.1 Predicted arabinose efflux permease, MFS family [Pseudomonas marginalis]